MCALARILVGLVGAARALRPEKAMSDEPAAPEIPHFEAFVERFSRGYVADSAEYAMRREHYQERAKAAQLQNEVPGRLWVAGVNHLWDRTHDEFSQLRGYRHSARPTSRGAARAGSLMEVAVHEDGDLSAKPTRKTADVHAGVAKTASKHWDLHALQPVDQGECGSCWAVSAATVLQAHAELAGMNRTFSAQHMVNCVPNPQECGGQGGCRGATVELAYAYAETMGMASKEEVEYEGKDRACSQQFATPVQDFHWKTLPENEYSPLVDAIYHHGPVAVAVTAEPWISYSQGIFDGCKKDAIIDHAVVLVGFGAENEVGYWQIRNSWGPLWGEGGHVRLMRSEEEYCGTDSEPEVGLECKGGRASVRVCGMCGVLYDTVLPQFSRPF